MEREIEFRAKGLYKDRWYYGYYVEHKRPMYHYIIDLDEIVMDTQHLINKDTLGQYTGLKDKNGNKIYEGDILKTKVDGRYYNRVIWFDTDENAYQTAKHGMGGYRLGGCQKYVFKSSDNEIIGNIYDNKDLLNLTTQSNSQSTC